MNRHLANALIVILSLLMIGFLDSFSALVSQSLLYGVLCLWAGYRLSRAGALATFMASVAVHLMSNDFATFSASEQAIQAVGEAVMLLLVGYLGYAQRRSRDLLEASYLTISQDRQQLEERAAQLQRLNGETLQLQKLMEMLQSTLDIQEALKLMGPFLGRLLPGSTGAVYLFQNSRNQLDLACHWGQPATTEPCLGPEECWCLRRGRNHEVVPDQPELLCPHWRADENQWHLCTPLLAHGETVGILALATPFELSEDTRRLLISTSEQLSMTLANLRLRESLRQQSIRDPLTGLFNRRFLEESLTREYSRAQRRSESLGVVMLDVDHFKTFNDTYGHEAGDLVLQAVGHYLPRAVRHEDVVCRYGGEEFCILFPSMSRADLELRLERLRQGLAAVAIVAGNHSLSITASFGAALYPEHNVEPHLLLKFADSALYEAKRAGRNCFRIAEAVPDSDSGEDSALAPAAQA